MVMSCVKKGCPGHLENAESILSEKELAALLEILRDSDRYRKLKNSMLLVCDTCKVYYVKSRR